MQAESADKYYSSDAQLALWMRELHRLVGGCGAAPFGWREMRFCFAETVKARTELGRQCAPLARLLAKLV
jgi:hypothetical protein